MTRRETALVKRAIELIMEDNTLEAVGILAPLVGWRYPAHEIISRAKGTIDIRKFASMPTSAFSYTVPEPKRKGR